MANLYYNAAVDTAWDTLGNWWNDDIFTDPALALPATGDTVYLYGYMTSGPTTPVTLNHIYAYTLGYGGQLSFTGAIGNATFQESQNSGTVTGDATFNGLSNNFGTVTGNATFNDTSINYGTVTGNATFNGTSINYSGAEVEGNATFNGTSYNSSVVVGDATFNDTSYNYDYFSEVGGEATLNDYSYNGGTLGYFNGMPTGLPVTFNDNSYNNAIVSGDATFNDFSYNSSQVTGNATFNHYSFNNNNFAVVFGDTATFNDYSYNAGDGGLFSSGVVNNNSIFNDYSYNNGMLSFTSGIATFNDSSYNNITGSASNGSYIFNDDSSNLQAYNEGKTATFNGPYAEGRIADNSSYGDLTINMTAPSGGGSDNTIARLLDLPWFINL